MVSAVEGPSNPMVSWIRVDRNQSRSQINILELAGRSMPGAVHPEENTPTQQQGIVSYLLLARP